MIAGGSSLCAASQGNLKAVNVKNRSFEIELRAAGGTKHPAGFLFT